MPSCNRTSIDTTEKTAAVFDRLIEFLLAALLLFMPLAFGVVHAWSEEIVVIMSGAIVICFLLKLLFCSDVCMRFSWTYVPVGLFLLIVIGQIAPLPSALIELISPNTVSLKKEVLSEVFANGSLLDTMTISFYRHATIHSLRLLISLAGVFVVVINVFTKPENIKRLLMTIALIGGGVAMIALAQQVLGNGKIFWSIMGKSTEGFSGPFVCHSHYGQFINLSIGAAIAWICVTLHENFAKKQPGPNEVLDYLGSRSARLLWLFIAIISLSAATVFVSLTRGGMISMLVAVGFTTILLASRKPMRGYGWVMVVFALAAFICILYVGFDAVYDRLASLRDLSAFKGRWQIVKDLTESFVHFPALGTGLGTHAVVYPMFQTINTTAFFTHAENEYAQLMEEAGLAGLLVLIIFGVMVWAAYAGNIRRTKSSINSAAYGLGFGIIAVLIHSLSDFGQHLCANVFLTIIFCALLLGMSAKMTNRQPTHCKALLTCGSKRVTLIVMICICAIWLRLTIDADNARRAQSSWAKAVRIKNAIDENPLDDIEADYKELLLHASRARDLQPGNLKFNYWYNVYLMRSIVLSDGYDREIQRISEDAMPALRQISKDLKKTIALCPTFGPAYSLAGQIEKFIFDDDSGAGKILKGFQLAPCDPIACFAAGRLDVMEGRFESSIPKFEKAVKVDSGLFKEVVKIYVNDISRPDLAVAMARGNIHRLRYVAGVMEDMQYDDLAGQVYMELISELEMKCSQETASANDLVTLAGIYRKHHANDKAIEFYHRALQKDYGQVSWRLTLAKALADANRIREALDEARICMSLRPQYDPAKKLIEKLSVIPSGFSGDID